MIKEARVTMLRRYRKCLPMRIYCNIFFNVIFREGWTYL